jgi:hypothetical protein
MQPIMEYDRANELCIELTRQGTNLNQVAAAANRLVGIVRDYGYEIDEIAELA